MTLETSTQELHTWEPLAIQAVLPVTGTEPIDGALQAWLMTLNSPHTRRAFAGHLAGTRKRPGAFQLIGVRTLGELRLGHLIAYRAHLVGARGAATHAQALSALRSFLGWVYSQGGLPFSLRAAERNLEIPPVTVENPYVTLTRPEAERLLEAADAPRLRCLVLFGLGGGLRPEELSKVDLVDLGQDADGGCILRVHGKGSKDRIIPLAAEVEAAIHRYLINTGRKWGGPGPLFLSEDRRGTHRLTTQGWRKILHGLVAKATISKVITPHSLRHTYAIEALRKCWDVVRVAKLLGHADPKTTMRYLNHLKLSELRDVVPTWMPVLGAV